MAPRLRVASLVAAAAAGAAALTVGATVLQSRDDPGPPPPQAARGCPSGPPLRLDLGVREDPEGRALSRASGLYARGRRADAGRVFARFGSLEALVGAALARWPRGTTPALRELAGAEPRSSLVRLHLGLVLVCTGQHRAALAALRAAKRLEPDTLSAIRAADFLHPDTVPGIPVFVPGFPAPAAIARLSPARSLEALRMRAKGPNVRAKLLLGVALQRIGKQRSAERQYVAAARLAPRSADAQVAAAVARFEKDRPERAFSRLGPLTRAFPRSPTVRFHLGLLLAWLGRVDEARRQFVLARAAGPSTRHGRLAGRFLAELRAAQEP